jgi:3-methylcrotonyl-CoA carboxylase alpha subunit
VPGYHGEDQADAVLATEAERIGFPLLIKASAGGGGKGMRAVAGPAEFHAALAAARREALASFGSDRVLLERHLQQVRHVEMQVFADSRGGCIHLFERDCSLQRRHQKVIEEAPAPRLAPQTRTRMGEAAVAAARAVGYVGAGTVEFLCEPSTGAFFFMEMNTRLQVEHAVTEMVTGTDLVEWQLRIAGGEPLPLAQHDLVLRGHSIEARVYAEDPAEGFMPRAGRLDRVAFPAGDDGLRIETGVRTGDVISPFYDPMIAKVIAWGSDRDEAARRLAHAIRSTLIVGPQTNLGFLAAAIGHPAFLSGGVHTAFIDDHLAEIEQGRLPSRETLAICALGMVLDRRKKASPRSDAWDDVGTWRLNHAGAETMVLTDKSGKAWSFQVGILGRDEVEVVFPDGERIALRGDLAGNRLRAELDGVIHAQFFRLSGAGPVLVRDGRSFRFSLPGLRRTGTQAAGSDGKLRSPMPGRVTAILVGEDEAVEAGRALVTVEAMKMEHTIRAPFQGRVAALHHQVGDQVVEGAVLLDLEKEGSAPPAA